MLSIRPELLKREFPLLSQNCESTGILPVPAFTDQRWSSCWQQAGGAGVHDAPCQQTSGKPCSLDLRLATPGQHHRGEIRENQGGGVVVDRIMSSKTVHVPIPETLHGKKDFADVIKVVNLEIGRLFCIVWWAQCNHMSS